MKSPQVREIPLAKSQPSVPPRTTVRAGKIATRRDAKVAFMTAIGLFVVMRNAVVILRIEMSSAVLAWGGR